MDTGSSRPLLSVTVMTDGTVHVAPDPETFGPEHVDQMVAVVGAVEDAIR